MRLKDIVLPQTDLLKPQAATFKGTVTEVGKMSSKTTVRRDELLVTSSDWLLQNLEQRLRKCRTS